LSADGVALYLGHRAVYPPPLAFGSTAGRTGAGTAGLRATARTASFTGTAGEEKGAGSGEEQGDRFHCIVFCLGLFGCLGVEEPQVRLMKRVI